jgi:hypothetical protein
MIYGIDPSVSCTGVARLDEHGELFDARVYVAETLRIACHYPSSMPRGFAYIELPRVYPGTKAKGDPNDLIAVAAVAGAWAASLPSVTFLAPSEWKGQLPKRVCEERIRAKLSARELETLERCLGPIPRSLRHNALDAVGIALHGAGRRIK